MQSTFFELYNAIYWLLESEEIPFRPIANPSLSQTEVSVLHALLGAFNHSHRGDRKPVTFSADPAHLHTLSRLRKVQTVTDTLRSLDEKGIISYAPATKGRPASVSFAPLFDWMNTESTPPAQPVPTASTPQTHQIPTTNAPDSHQIHNGFSPLNGEHSHHISTGAEELRIKKEELDKPSPLTPQGEAAGKISNSSAPPAEPPMHRSPPPVAVPPLPPDESAMRRSMYETQYPTTMQNSGDVLDERFLAFWKAYVPRYGNSTYENTAHCYVGLLAEYPHEEMMERLRIWQRLVKGGHITHGTKGGPLFWLDSGQYRCPEVEAAIAKSRPQWQRKAAPQTVATGPALPEGWNPAAYKMMKDNEQAKYEEQLREWGFIVCPPTPEELAAYRGCDRWYTQDAQEAERRLSMVVPVPRDAVAQEPSTSPPTPEGAAYRSPEWNAKYKTFKSELNY